MRISLPEAKELFPDPREECRMVDLVDLEANPAFRRVLVVLQRRAYRPGLSVDDPQFTTEAAKAEGVTDALREIEVVLRKLSKQFEEG